MLERVRGTQERGLGLLWAAVATFAVAVSALAEEPVSTETTGGGYEIWAVDQGTNKVHIIVADDGAPGGFKAAEEIDLGAIGIDMPHMIDFTSDFAYAFIANVQSGNVVVVRAADRKVLATLDTGHMSHMARVHPDDSRILVDVMHETGAIAEIVPDWVNETFTLGRRLVIAEDPVFAARASEFAGSSPVCHDNTADGRYAFVTLGPPLAKGGLVVLDVESFRLESAHPPSELSVNCGTMRSRDGSKIYVNGGSTEAGHWYVLDAATHEPIPTAGGEIRRSSRGTDAHGVWLTPGGERLWMINRHSSNAIVIDTATDEVVAEIADVGKSPDLVVFSPDGSRAFITLRGPKPRSGGHAIAGTTPGVAVLDAATRELLSLVEPSKGNEDSDFHGIGMRPTG